MCVCVCEAPTILTDVRETDPIMQKDVLGPVLPVMAVSSLDAAIAFINKQEKPLCVYAYSSNSTVTRLIGIFFEFSRNQV